MSDAPILREMLEFWEASRKEGRVLTASEVCARFSREDQLVALERKLLDLQGVGAQGIGTVQSPPRNGGRYDDSDDDPTGAATRHNPQRERSDNPVGPIELGDYELLDELGRGGMGTIYRARHKILQTIVAVKIVSQGPTADPGMISRFQREMQLIGKLDHPNIVRATDARMIDGAYVFVMEYLSGVSLKELVRAAGAVPFGVACEIIRQTAMGLSHAHENDVIHRDIKPSNILITERGVAKLLDLGIARCTTHESSETLTGGVLGTPDYMPPEQWEDSSTAGQAADIYSLGCTLHYLIAGTAPFGGDQYKSLTRKMRAHLYATADRLDESSLDCPAELADFVQQMMAKEPGDRVASAAVVAEELAKWAEFGGIAPFFAEAQPLTEQLIKRVQAGTGSTADTHELPETEHGKDKRTASRTRRTLDDDVDIRKRAFLPSVMVLIGLTSLAMAYYSPWTTDAWVRSFDLLERSSAIQWPRGTGFLIEAVRMIVFVSLAGLVASHRFRSELRRLFSLGYHGWGVNIARALFLLVVAYFGYMECSRHLSLDGAAAEMAAWATEQGIDTTPQIEWAPYATYLPYSLVAYLYALPLLTVVPLYAGGRDIARVWQELRSVLSQLKGSRQTDSFILNEIALFEDRCQQVSARYFDALAILSLAIQYEYWIGRYTLTDQGMGTMILAWFFGGLAFWFILSIAWIYNNSIEAGRTALLRNASSELKNYSQTFSAVSFLRWILIGRVSGLAVLSLALPMIHWNLFHSGS